MSAWRLVVQELHERGPLTSRQFMADCDCGEALKRARELGLVQSPGRGGQSLYMPWTLTDLGRDYCEGRARLCTLFVPHPGTRARAKGSVYAVQAACGVAA